MKITLSSHDGQEIYAEFYTGRELGHSERMIFTTKHPMNYNLSVKYERLPLKEQVANTKEWFRDLFRR